MKVKEHVITKYIIVVNNDKVFFDTSIKEVLKVHHAAYVQLMSDHGNPEDNARMMRALLDDYTSNGNEPANVVLSGFDYCPEIIEAIESRNCKLVWAC